MSNLNENLNKCVFLTLVAASTSAPLLSSSVTMFRCPSLELRCRAFRPFCETEREKGRGRKRWREEKKGGESEKDREEGKEMV